MSDRELALALTKIIAKEVLDRTWNDLVDNDLTELQQVTSVVTEAYAAAQEFVKNCVESDNN